MKKTLLLILLFVILGLPASKSLSYATSDPGKQTVVDDTTKDPKSKYNAKYEPSVGTHCSSVLLTSSAALTVKHCLGPSPSSFGTIYPGESGLQTPFGYMNIRTYIPHSTYDIAILKGTDNDKSSAYKYYLKNIKTEVKGLTDDELDKLKGKKIYSYGYPYQFSGYKQYLSTGTVEFYEKTPHNVLRTTMPATGGQSGSGVFLQENDQLIGIIITATPNGQANVLPISQEIANWINQNTN
ncbi:trypsin-like serine peptidase [Staphylococcus lutrae]|uniref:Serine protease n=1 Tax=Staphylococcus lutrae TaxID=155085 RepID=A0AAC9RT25_9STAP|nr:trypsin-like peptidase domain-containing protein [Staphylococcus lutrae]ARJ51146.1 serine protease [Staphylococcus lutrae]PNZ37928.1 serine protease [Staphylococcus lutrae]